MDGLNTYGYLQSSCRKEKISASENAITVSCSKLVALSAKADLENLKIQHELQKR